MNELEIFKTAMGKQSQRIAQLSLDLDLAHSQIDHMAKELNDLTEQFEQLKSQQLTDEKSGE